MPGPAPLARDRVQHVHRGEQSGWPSERAQPLVEDRLDLAFSRDAPEKVYVQDRLWQRRREVVDWLEGGARFYICGDAKAMAKDVRATLVRIYADVKALPADAAEAAVAGLDRDKRYLQDVY